jgi:hypothetical protein
MDGRKTDYAGKGNIFIDKNGSLVLEMGARIIRSTLERSGLTS